MNLTATEIDIGTRLPAVLLNETDAEELGVHPLDRVQIRHHGGVSIGIVELTEGLVPAGTLGVTKRLGHVAGEVTVTLTQQPGSVQHIRKKLDDVELEQSEIERIVRDIDDERLSDVELGAYVTGIYANGLSLSETMYLAECMTAVGEVLDWTDGVVADKHSIGGVAGNRVTPVIVPIVAAAGVKIPKTSSRAVTSAAGTADTVEVFCDVEFSVSEIRDVVTETNGCLAWGGSVNLSPVDDKIIRAETPLSIDPAGQIIASVLSKKRSAGSTHVVVDIPYGESAKMESLAEARELASDFRRVAEYLGLHAECAITRGNQPIGCGVGPVLEARDVLRVLDGGGPEDLRSKSLRLADILLDMSDVDEDAAAILDDGRALSKFRDIVAAQRGDPAVTVEDLVPGPQTTTVHAEAGGVVTHVDNRLVNDVARRAGAPKDKRAGIELHRRVSDGVAAGDPLFTIYAEKRSKLEDAAEWADRTETVRVRDPDESLVERV